VLTVATRFQQIGDPHPGIDAAAGSLDRLLDLAAKDDAEGFGDAPWPPHFRKAKGEAPRVTPSRAKMPLIVVANSANKEAALDGLERWKARHPEVGRLLAVDDILTDSKRGRSSTWTAYA